MGTLAGQTRRKSRRGGQLSINESRNSQSTWAVHMRNGSSMCNPLQMPRADSAVLSTLRFFNGFILAPDESSSNCTFCEIVVTSYPFRHISLLRPLTASNPVSVDRGMLETTHCRIPAQRAPSTAAPSEGIRRAGSALRGVVCYSPGRTGWSRRRAIVRSTQTRPWCTVE